MTTRLKSMFDARIAVPAVLLVAVALTASARAADPETKYVSDAEAEADARRIEGETTVTMVEGLAVSLWASEKLLANAIALHMDDRGRALITITNRAGESELEIRSAPPHWRQETMKLTSVEDRRAMLHRELAPELSDQNTWINDVNGDGSHDWRDLAVRQEEVWWLEDESGSGRANRAELFIRDFNDEITDVAGAVAYHEGDVFLGVGPDMWRLRDTDGDRMADTKESISHGYNVHVGFAAHNMSGAKVGPDGRIYWSIGDMGLNVTDKEGNHWYYPNTGAILRSEPDGSGFEVFAYGVRNTHEFEFDKYGNIISVDNDGDHQGEFERIVYLVNGSDSGWRTNWQFGKYTDPRNNGYNTWMDENYFRPRFDEQAAHLLPPIAEGWAGPAGMAYNPGTALDDTWKDTFFVSSFRGNFANSPLMAFTLQPSGAGFELASQREALRGILVVGVDVGPDGALYMTDWIQGWGRGGTGRIWKLDTPTAAETAARRETERLLAEDFSRDAFVDLAARLRHVDMRVRQKAQFELAKRNAATTLREALAPDQPQLARVHGIWGIGQISRGGSPSAADALIPLLGDADPEIRAQAAKTLGDVRYRPAGNALTAILSDDAPRARFFAAEALGRIGHRPGFDAIVRMLEANDDEDVYLRHGGSIALSRLGDADALAALADHSSRAVRIAAVVALRRMENPAVARFLQDSDEYVVTNAARAIRDDAFIDEAMPALAAVLDQPRFLNEPLIRRAIDANLYAGGPDAARRLATFALRTDALEATRVEALNALSRWSGSSEFDRVTGVHRGAVRNDPELARAALPAVVEQLLRPGAGSALELAAIGAVRELEYQRAVPALRALLEEGDEPAVRIAALGALRELGFPDMGDAVRLALEDEESRVRMSALGMIGELGLPADMTASMLATIVDGGTAAEKQAAYPILGRAGDPASRRILGEHLARLTAGSIEPEVALDLILAAEAAGSPALTEQLRAYQTAKPQGDPVAEFREALVGGTVQSGRRIFVQHPVVQCTRCHTTNGQAGGVGPDLQGVGSRLTREQLLEALVDPSARIATGFGSVTFTLRSGEVVRGVLAEESGDRVVVTQAAGDARSVPNADIVERVNAPSAMPSMQNILTRPEMRDVVEYLASLR